MSPENQVPWHAGTLIEGKYELLEQIGSGGMGTVHAARRLSLGDLVAIKSIRPDRINADNRARFIREARAVARVRHPNVISVFDYGEAASGRPYMVMEFIEGPTLAQVLAAGRVPLARGLEVFADVCMAVEAGHRRGVVHRDLKPANVMLAPSDDGTENVKVLDFGLARLVEQEGPDLTRAGALAGTCSYMSPETIEQRTAGPASDLFSLGVMLYELTTGHKPFVGDNPIATIMAICEGQYTPPRELQPELPASVVEAIEAALQRDLSARPSSAAALAAMALGRTIETRVQLSQLGGSRASQVARRRPTGSSSESRLDPSASIRDPGVPRPTPTRPSEELTVDELPLPPPAASSPSTDSQPDTLSGDSSALMRDAEGLHAILAAPPFVGRRLELDTLGELLAGARAGEVPLALLLGEPGMGRSRLLRHFGELARERGALVLEGRFWGYEGTRAPAGEVFARMLGLAPSGGLAPGVDRRSNFAELAARFEQRAAGQTLVLLLDDLHLASRRDLEFLTYLVRGSQHGTAILVVASARAAPARTDAHTELSRWLVQLAGLRTRSVMSLSGLDEDELRSWLQAAFGRLRIRPRDLRKLRQASEGAPAFLAELVRNLVARATLRRDEVEGTWVCAALERDVLPEGLRAAVGELLERLEPPLRELLETAAVLGEQLKLELLERTMGLDEAELDARLDALIAQDLLVERAPESGADLHFPSSTVRQLVYERMSTRRRRRLHRAVVEALVASSAASGPKPSLAKTLVWHYRAIARWEATLTWGLVAARFALTQHDYDAAELTLEHVTAAMHELGHAAVNARDQLRIAALSGALNARIGRYEQGSARLREARELLALHPELSQDLSPAQLPGLRPIPYLRFEIALSLARCRLGLGKLELAARSGREALAHAHELDPSALGGPAARLEAEWDARVALGHTLARFGSWDEACEVLQPIVDAAPLPLLRVLHVLALRERGWIAARRGELTSAQAYAAQARAEAKACREPLADYCAASLTAVACSSRGDNRAALPHYREALKLARALSLRRREMIEEANLAMSLTPEGQLDEAIAHMLSVRSICEELGDLASAGDARVGLGKVLVRRGDLDEAILSFRRGHAACTAHGRHEYANIALLELGRCELAREHWEAAREALERARAGFEELGSLHRWEVELELARAERGRGDPAGARRHAEQARVILEQLRSEQGPRVDERVEAALAQLEGLS